MPYWGVPIEGDSINFEWPTQEMWDNMSPDVSIKSITFTLENRFGESMIGSVRVHLSNG
jgi:hypothetical protein